MSYLDQAGRAVLRVPQQCLSSPSPTVMPAKSRGAITDSGPYPTESCCVFATAAAPWVFVLHSTSTLVPNRYSKSTHGDINVRERPSASAYPRTAPADQVS